MYYHVKPLQYNAKPDRPDPIYAKKMQELIGGQFGEMTVMMQYLFQGWSCRGPQKYRDMLLDIATEEIGHVEMLAAMIARLLEGAPLKAQEEAVEKVPVVGAVLGGTNTTDAILAGMNPQHAIVAGLGATPRDSNGVPWSGAFIVASGNLAADFRSNLNAESQGLVQAVRLYEMTDDRGVRDMLSFNIARDTMHQNQWAAALEELKADGLADFVVPHTFPRERMMESQAYTFWNLSQGEESAEGRWAKGPSIDGQGQFEYLASPQPLSTDLGEPPQPDPRLHGTAKQPIPVGSSGGPNPRARARQVGG
jgi:Mn-containing catalase